MTILGANTGSGDGVWGTGNVGVRGTGTLAGGIYPRIVDASGAAQVAVANMGIYA